MPKKRNKELNYMRSLSQLYVYYDYLGRTPRSDRNENLKQHILNSMTSVSTQASNTLDSKISMIRNLADFEKQKEIEFLTLLSGGKNNINLEDLLNKSGDPVKDLNNTINQLLNIKNIYNRNRLLFTNTNMQAPLISFVMDYFRKKWNNKNGLDKLISDISNSINLNIPLDQQREVIKGIVGSRVQECLEKALEVMFKGKQFRGAGLESGIKDKVSGKQKTDYENAYRELLNAIGKVSGDNGLSYLMYRSLGLDKLVDELTNSIELKNSNIQVGKYNYSKTVMYKTKGYTHEALTTTIMDQVIKKVNQNNQALWTGSFNAKVDTTLFINIDSAAIQNITDNILIGSQGRQKNIERFNDIGNYIDQLNKGMVVYVSSKNRGGISFKGFQVENIKFKSLKEILNQNYDQAYVGALLQYMPGALKGGQKIPEEYRKQIASNIATFLFDDFYIDAENMTQGHRGSVHIMDLNGIYMPLSSILFLLADAMDSERKNDYKSLIKMEFEFPKNILYPEDKWNKVRKNHTSHELWVNQRNYALENSNIEVFILSNFQNLISQYTSFI